MADKPKSQKPASKITDKKNESVKYTTSNPAKSFPKNFKSTAEIKISEKLIGQIMG